MINKHRGQRWLYVYVETLQQKDIAYFLQGTLISSTFLLRFSNSPNSTLSDIAKSMMIYFNDDLSPHRALAIDLCSRGFEIWQQYFDAMEALRSLFTLATTSKKESINVRNPGPQARLAVLHIASSNSPLFMTTLSLDILHPRSIEYSKSVLQIIAFLIRKVCSLYVILEMKCSHTKEPAGFIS